MLRKGGLARILITLLGIAFILMGAAEAGLGFVGKRATAVITSIRRVGGERDEVIPGRYTYDLGYTFRLPDGREISGWNRKIRDATYVKAGGSSTTVVRYMPWFPQINALEEDTGPGARQLLLVISGVVLIFLINK